MRLVVFGAIGDPARRGRRPRRISSLSLRLLVGQSVESFVERGARRDPQQGKDPVEVPPDGSVRDVQALTDFAIG